MVMVYGVMVYGDGVYLLRTLSLFIAGGKGELLAEVWMEVVVDEWISEDPRLNTPHSTQYNTTHSTQYFPTPPSPRHPRPCR
jgi:hypothetical protein